MQVLTADWCMHARRMPVWTGIQYLFFWLTSVAWMFGQLAVGQVSDCCAQCNTGYVSLNSAMTSINCLIPGRTGRPNWQNCPVECARGGAFFSLYCMGCDYNQYQDRYNCKADISCKACPSGKVGTGDVTDLCQRCEVGYKILNYACSACDPGKYQGSEHQTFCSDCAPGSFSSSGASSCSVWTTCTAGQYVSTAGGSTQNRLCINCPAGKYTTGTNIVTCPDCGAGTFQPLEGKTSCSTFNCCQAGQKTTRYGSATQDYACEACPSPWTTLLGSETACTSCVAGTYQDTTVNPATCTTCACTGGGERYISCPAGSTKKGCPYCTGTQAGSYCAAGMQPSAVCDGLGTTDTTCVACPAGSHKPNGNQRSCEQCPTGFYKPAPASINNCTACTNRNPTNQNLAFYTAWTASAATNTCPWYVCFGDAVYGACKTLSVYAIQVVYSWILQEFCYWTMRVMRVADWEVVARWSHR